MARSPGHQKWPDHRVEETRTNLRMQVELDGQTIADSADIIRLDEDEHPPRYYFPLSDVSMEALEPSETTTRCPFKGQAQYFHLKIGDQRMEDGAWTYAEPYDEHRDLRDRIAFHDDKIPGLEINKLDQSGVRPQPQH